MGRLLFRVGPDSPSPPQPSAGETGPPQMDDNGHDWSGWSKDTLYDVEKVVSATRSGSGWTLMIKWVGHPVATPEQLSAFLRNPCASLPEIRREISECQERYYLENPGQRPVEADAAGYDRPAPSRVQPSRGCRDSRPRAGADPLFTADCEAASFQPPSALCELLAVAASTAERRLHARQFLAGDGSLDSDRYCSDPRRILSMCCRGATRLRGGGFE